MKSTFNNIMKLCLSISLISSFFIQKTVHADEINLFSDKAISILADSGEVIYSKNANKVDFPASTTKIMTAMVMMDHLKENDKIQMTKRSIQEEKSNSQILFTEGEVLDRNTALKTMMILSANDLAYAIGERVGGNMDNFVRMMNEKAKKIGANHTNFMNPNGLHNVNHYTTAHDLALITKEALKYPLIIKAMGTKDARISTSKQKNVYIFNRGKMFKNPYFYAGKTGYTDSARNTLIEIDKKDGQMIINILLRSSKPQYLQDIKLLDSYAFSRIHKKTLIKQGDWQRELKIRNNLIQTKIPNDLSFLTALGSNVNYDIKIKPLNVIDKSYKENGISKNQKLGTVEVWTNNEELFSTALLAAKSYDRPTIVSMNTFIIAGSVILLLVLIYFITKPKRKREYM
ncbi:serine hydrolase [Gottfriedia acidiceleris]|uniref:D-alanyl-D-alanine carboxypeptidase family protein n=1 Tax=Bacillaceae TaxID=186817 RepID=UPI000BEE1308|nr:MULTISPECIES: serine hydrolase [unclassified Bacillus (in: firmicutes)]PEC49975.1 D-alanyl-D-alanine carboxypeptidase [Bacillus sp. AFS096315]PFM79352.1 D-alanyl-D-alanine carboxypeptidase [Bacillus sp. AFS077874]